MLAKDSAVHLLVVPIYQKNLSSSDSMLTHMFICQKYFCLI
ncbi:Uncharacterised protein [Klebsiella pneumoniae]|nr:Uncharacterised protein [Klebsiella pneumoniae]VTN30148.1 Uncharacterised protein [Klebsiella pneumoniae]